MEAKCCQTKLPILASNALLPPDTPLTADAPLSPDAPLPPDVPLPPDALLSPNALLPLDVSLLSDEPLPRDAPLPSDAPMNLCLAMHPCLPMHHSAPCLGNEATRFIVHLGSQDTSELHLHKLLPCWFEGRLSGGIERGESNKLRDSHFVYNICNMHHHFVIISLCLFCTGIRSHTM